MHFRPYRRKTFFKLFLVDFLLFMLKTLVKYKILLIFGKNLKNVFSKKEHKILIKRPPTKISGNPQFFDQNFVKKHFEVRGPYPRFGAFISKAETRNFCKRGKNVFFVLPIF